MLRNLQRVTTNAWHNKRHILTFLLNTVSVLGCRMSSTSGKYKDLKSVADFGYEFNAEGQLRNLKSGDPFTFVDQEHYEALGEVITEEVYKLLQDRAGLDIHYLDNQKKSFVFVSPGYENKDNLLCLIHGSGVVRAGQWARKLIINNDLEKGTQIPYIKEAIKLGLGVVVFNTNQNYFIDDENVKRKLAGSSNPEDHASTAWKQLVAPSKARNIIIVAHSYGGVVTMALAQSAQDDFLNRVKGIYFTDSVHFSLTKSADLNGHLVKISKNYVTSEKPVATLIKSSSNDVARYSAGHKVHEWTSWSCQDTIFQQIKSTLNLEDKNGDSSTGEHESKDSKHEL
eukprot:TRINITY_DN2713_c0_g1_i18.p1 TRINITY_DN2713_c0_g1~~TRINITY_DN2713_c0_g1_i18.p1  ORF type:complete len:341 (-),score=75.48 TRINITY_DN2713_c0_g1_i18:147-1169(-)